jgi:ABC-type antimicrobial peptide transport system permease subunit
LVLVDGLRHVAVGGGVGLLVALYATRFLSSFLYDQNPADPLAYGGAMFLLGIVALVSSAILTLRALRVDPVDALRAD